jgi:hypothetical protein
MIHGPACTADASEIRNSSRISLPSRGEGQGEGERSILGERLHLGCPFGRTVEPIFSEAYRKKHAQPTAPS